jgi:hypothetical protein
LVLFCVVPLTAAQGLADVARKSGAKPGARVYTNADLPAVEPASAAPVQAAAEAEADDAADEKEASRDGDMDSGAAESPAPLIEAPVKAREKRSEAYWRARAQDLRERMARATADVSGMAARLDALDAAAASPAVEQERKLAAAALAKGLANLDYLRDEETRLEARARLENVPISWIR